MKNFFFPKQSQNLIEKNIECFFLNSIFTIFQKKKLILFTLVATKNLYLINSGQKRVQK
jgi:hypothetical protein